VYVARVMIKVQYTSLQLTPRRRAVLRVCAMFQGLTSLASYLDWIFVLDFTSWIKRSHFCYYCADVCGFLAPFCSEYSCARPSTGRSGQVVDSVCMSQFSWGAWPISCSRSTITVTIGLFFAYCALVRNSLQTSCLQWVMTRYLTPDTMLEIGARK